MIIKTLIIDDNASDIQNIKSVLTKLARGTDIHFEYHSVSDGSNILYEADWYIVDIDLGKADNGFRVAGDILSHYPEGKIIFCTSHPEFVFNAFHLNVFYYVRKDLLAEDMLSVIKKYRIEMQSRLTFRHHENGKLIPIPLERIVYFEVVRYDLYIHCKNEEYQERNTLKNIIQALPENLFVQPSRSFLVNIKHIRDIDGKNIILYDGTKIPVSRERIKEVTRIYFNSLALR